MRDGATLVAPVARLHVFLLGPPRAELDGTPIEVDTRKAIALLAYLAVSGERKSRDTLATLLWPEYDGEHARAAFRRTLSALNKALGGEGLLIDRSSVALDRSAALVDVAEFRRLIAESHLEEAVALYRGDFLAGFGLKDSIEFDDWQFFELDGLKRELAVALERLARECAERGELDRGIDHARRWLGLDSLQEPAHRLLMQLYAWSGQRAAGLRQYRECVRFLDAELGVTPLQETTELYEAIREDRLSRPEAPRKPRHAAARPPRAEAYPLVGRSKEWAALTAAYDRVGPDGRLAVLEGEAGIGKTRLVEEFLAHVQAGGAATIASRSNEGESGLAFGAVAETLRAALGREGGWLDAVPAHWVGEAGRLVPELAARDEPVPPLDSPGAQSRFFEGLSQVLLAACAGSSPGVLFVDDAHWADEPSLEVLAYLARRLRARPVLVLLAWRPEEMPPGHRLHRLAAGTTVVPLGRLRREDVAELARAARAEELGDRLFRETDGLPLFVVEYLAALAEHDAGDWPLPGSIAELLRSRLAAVSETGRQVLAAGSVIGRPFELEVVREASGRSDDEVVSALEEATRRGLLEEVADGYDFGHEEVRALVYAETSMARRRLLHRRVADALAARGRRDSGAQAGLIAEHYRLSGQEAEAAEQFRLAGERARSLFANAEALAHLRSALALGHPDASGLHESVGDLLTLLGEYGAAIASYETAAALSEPDRVAALEHKLGSVYARRGDFDLAAGNFEAALEGLVDPARRARLEADRSLTEHRRGRAGEALVLAERALELAEEAGDEQALSQAHNILGVLASSRGDLDEARRQLEQSLALAGRLHDPGARVAALNNLALVARAQDDLDRSLALTTTALELCVAQGDRHREAALHNNLADLLHAAGRSEDAMSHLKRAVAIFAEIGADAGEAQPEIWKLVEW